MKPARILLGVTGSIAAYRAADVASDLTKRGHIVDVVMTAEAVRFIGPLTLGALTHRPVVTDLWSEGQAGHVGHIELADAADVVLVAPATAHLLAQMRLGLAPDALTALLLATRAPILLAPAMNGHMWEHPATQENVRVLTERGVRWVGPDTGMLACGYAGVGRMAAVEKVIEATLAILGPGGKV
jgi:phosphopantothenoylcysteine decarboxylase